MAVTPTYDYYQGACPVLMRERINGRVIAEYDAFLDSAGYTWTLYPRKSRGYCPSVPFKPKKVTIFQAKPLERQPEPPPEPKAPEGATKIEQIPTAEQIPLIKNTYK